VPYADVTPGARTFKWNFAPYRELNSARSVLELVIAAVPFVLIWVLLWAALDAGYWFGLILDSRPARE